MNRPPHPSQADRLLFWAVHTAFWLVMLGAGMIVAQAFAPSLPNPALLVGAPVAACFAMTAALRWLFIHDHALRRMGISKAGMMIGGPLAGAVVITLLVGGLDAGRVEPSLRIGLAARFVLNAALLATWSALYFGSQLLRERQLTEMRALEAESLACRNELRHIQGQISPHFLFNALNTILACKNDPDAIESVTQSLAKYLRFLLRPSATLEPLSQEIDALEEYLTIQSFRFGDRLNCRIDCDLDIRRIPVLPVMVQPLVENALKHGTVNDGPPLQVIIRAWREKDRLFIEVANTGSWATPDPATSIGTGLHTLQRRLELFGGPEATVTIRDDEGWVRALLTLPLAKEYAAPAGVAEPPSRLEPTT